MAKKGNDDVYVVRALREDLDRVLENSPRTIERTKEWMRAYFVDGKSSVAIAKEAGVPPQSVGNAIRDIRAKLAEQAAPMTYVQASLNLPIALVVELQALSAAFGPHVADVPTEVAEAAFSPVLKAVRTAAEKFSRAR